jgi:hypothetical protein
MARTRQAWLAAPEEAPGLPRFGALCGDEDFDKPRSRNARSEAARAPRSATTDRGGGAVWSAAAVVTQLLERHCTQAFPVPFAQAPFRIHSAARLSSVM